jgi:hypothetical protein
MEAARNPCASVVRTPEEVPDGIEEVHMAKKAATKKTRKVIKSANDGQFKSTDFAKKHPKSTYRQTVKAKKSKAK